jgi:aspartyl-tRNA(Asn)/glutamyl-tRNA(Gln) amidotransferase subunit C
MAVTREDVIQIAELARLRLSAEEIDQFLEQLNGILEHAEELKELDTAAVRALPGIAEGSAPRRSDQLGPDLLRLPLPDFAQGWQDGFFTVPRLAALDSSELEEPFEDKARIDSAGRPDEAAVLEGAE